MQNSGLDKLKSNKSPYDKKILENCEKKETLTCRGRAQKIREKNLHQSLGPEADH